MIAGGGAASGLMALGALGLATRTLTPATFGLLAIAQSFALVMERFGTFQPWQALIHYGSRARAEENVPTLRGLVRAGYLLDVAGGLATVVIGALLLTVADRTLEITAEAHPYAVAYLVAFVMRPAGTAVATLRMFDCFEQTVYARTIGQGIRVIGAVILWSLRAAPSAWVLLWITADLLPSLWQNVAAARVLRREGLLAGDHVRLRELEGAMPGLWKMFGTTNLHAMLKGVVRDLDVLVVGVLLGPAAAAVVRVVRQLGSAIGQLGDPLLQAIYPELADAAARHHHADFAHVVRRTAQSAMAMAVMVLLICWSAGGWILTMSSGAAYAGAANAFGWYATAQAIALALVPLSPALLALGGATASLRAVAIASVVYVATLLPLVTHFGPVGAGIAQALFSGAWAVLAGHALRERWRIMDPDTAPLSPVTVSLT